LPGHEIENGKNWHGAFAFVTVVTYAWVAIRPLGATNMNVSNSQADDSAFPAVFVVLSTFIGVLVWLCVMLGSLPQY
jgi:hypothetical protein